MAKKASPYYDVSAIGNAVAAGNHRGVIGGLWEEIGNLQFDFLKAQGLRPEHTLLDIGCGCLRGGVHFISYLDRGNYFGVDINQSLLDAGYETELAKARLQDRLPRENLACLSDFDFSAFGRSFDFALAQSVFTHLPFSQVRQCLERLVLAVRPGGTFLATFFELPEGLPATTEFVHQPGGIVTRAAEDPYHYKVSDFVRACSGLSWSLRYIGDWNHPRAQRMIAFDRPRDPEETKPAAD